MIFSEPTPHGITVPNTVGGMATINTTLALQANLQISGNGGSSDFAGGEWVIDVALITSAHYVPFPIAGGKITAPVMIPLPLPAANYRLRCIAAPTDISKTPIGLLLSR